MRQEVLEQGEDKVIAAAIAEGKTPAEIAQFYTDRFFADERKVNIIPAKHFPKATDHVTEMLEIVDGLVEAGHAYEVRGNVYFDVSSFGDYGNLSGNIQDAELLEAVRVEADPLKRDPRDFHAVEAGGAGPRPQVAQPLGRGLPGLAHRVLRDVRKVPGQAVRPAHRRRGQHLPAPRRRNRPERGLHRRTGGERLDARPAPAGGRREDGQVRRQLLHPGGRRKPGHRPPRLPLPVPDGALPHPAQLHLHRAQGRPARPAPAA